MGGQVSIEIVKMWYLPNEISPVRERELFNWSHMFSRGHLFPLLLPPASSYLLWWKGKKHDFREGLNIKHSFPWSILVQLYVDIFLVISATWNFSITRVSEDILGMNNIFYLVGICMGFPSNLSSCDSEQTASKISSFKSLSGINTQCFSRWNLIVDAFPWKQTVAQLFCGL